MLGLGELPKEYNKAVHGPYDPAVFYGKKDVPLSQVCHIITSKLRFRTSSFLYDETVK
jgi:hypothetical protein